MSVILFDENWTQTTTDKVLIDVPKVIDILTTGVSNDHVTLRARDHICNHYLIIHNFCTTNTLQQKPQKITKAGHRFIRIFTISMSSPLGIRHGPSFIQTWNHFNYRNNNLFKVWLKCAQWFWRRFSNFINALLFFLFKYNLPLKRCVTFHWSHQPKMISAKFGKNCPVVLYFYYCAIFSPWKGCEPFIWTNQNSLVPIWLKLA